MGLWPPQAPRLGRVRGSHTLANTAPGAGAKVRVAPCHAVRAPWASSVNPADEKRFAYGAGEAVTWVHLEPWNLAGDKLSISGIQWRLQQALAALSAEPSFPSITRACVLVREEETAETKRETDN